MANTVDIAGCQVGPGESCFIIAEAGVNHNGDSTLAHKLVDAAVQAGADAVKFQTYEAGRLVTFDAPQAEYQQGNTGADESQYEMLRRLELSHETHHALKGRCDGQDILFLSSPFDEQSADFLVELGLPALKIPSGEITNLTYLAHVARHGLPLIVSTGMSTLGEVEQAIRTIEEAGDAPVILLHCVSTYPADPADANLRAMLTMKEAFGLPVGYSDHTPGIEVALAATALGACVIEKHFTLDRTLPGPDHKASLEPDMLKAMIDGIRTVEKALGHGRKAPAASELDTAQVARKSLVAARDIPAGVVLTDDMITIKRPGTGLPPAMHPFVMGRKARQTIPAGTVLSLEMLS